MDLPLQISRLLEHGSHRARRVRGRDLDRRGCSPDDLRRGGRALRATRACTPRRSGRTRRRARRDLHVEQRRAPRGVPGGAEHGCRSAHAQPAALPGAADLHREPRRGQGDHRRLDADPAAGPGPAAAAHGRARGGRRRRRRGAVRRPPRRCRCTAGTICSPASRRRTSGRTSTSATPPPSATRPAPPATRRASRTRTAPSGCTRWRSAWPRASGSRRRRKTWSSCRCSTRWPGACRTRL